LSIWLNGGPGGSSLVGALEENGPCFVSDDSNSTYLNPWAWNNEVNMLYIDQPVQVGYSYDTLFNGTLTYSGDDDYNITLSDFPDGVPEQNHTFLVGTFASQNLTYTANSSVHAAHALWHFLQTFLEEFPAYKPHDEKVSLWTESYGGKYGPSFTHFFQTQNEKISNGTICAPGAHYMHLDTLGIINGCVDDIFLQPSYPSFAFNNTYGIQALNRSAYEEQMHELERPGGLLDKIRECQQMAKEADPEEHGDVKRVNQFCRRIANETEGKISAPFFQTKKVCKHVNPSLLTIS
jgi:carboxypeptidase C (cathepsin A)